MIGLSDFLFFDSYAISFGIIFSTVYVGFVAQFVAVSYSRRWSIRRLHFGLHGDMILEMEAIMRVKINDLSAAGPALDRKMKAAIRNRPGRRAKDGSQKTSDISRYTVGTCDVCGAEFWGPKSALRCSPECSLVVIRQQLAAVTERRRAAALARVVPEVVSCCSCCFQPVPLGREYCSNACKQREFRRRKKLAPWTGLQAHQQFADGEFVCTWVSRKPFEVA